MKIEQIIKSTNDNSMRIAFCETILVNLKVNVVHS